MPVQLLMSNLDKSLLIVSEAGMEVSRTETVQSS